MSFNELYEPVGIGPSGHPLRATGRLAYVDGLAIEKTLIDATVANYVRLTGRRGMPGLATPLNMIVKLRSVKTLVSVPDIGLSTGKTGTPDIILAAPMTGLTTAGKSIVIPISGLVPEIAEGDHLYARIGAAASAAEYVVDIKIMALLEKSN